MTDATSSFKLVLDADATLAEQKLRAFVSQIQSALRNIETQYQAGAITGQQAAQQSIAVRQGAPEQASAFGVDPSALKAALTEANVAAFRAGAQGLKEGITDALKQAQRDAAKASGISPVNTLANGANITDAELRDTALARVAALQKSALGQQAFLDNGGPQASAELTTINAQVRAETLKILDETTVYAEYLAQSSVYQKDINAQKQIEVSKINAANPQYLANQSTAASAAKTDSELLRVQQLRKELGLGETQLNSQSSLSAIMGERVVLEKQLAADTKEQAALAAKNILPTGAYSRSLVPPGPSTPPPSVLGKLGGNFARGAEYFVGAGAAFSIYGQLQQAVQQAQKLQVEFVTLQQQMNSLGRSDALQQTKQNILDLANASGQAADQITQVQIQMNGLFQNQSEAARATSESVKLATATGTDLQQVANTVSAVTDAYGSSATKVGNIAISLQNQTGQSASEIVQFLGNVAPVAKQAGFSLEQIGAIGAVAAQSSGRSISAISEGLNRVIPAMQTNEDKILTLVRLTPQLAGQYANILSDFGSGNLAAVFDALGKSYGTLTQAEQNQVDSLLGGRRETQNLIGVFNNYGRVLDTTTKATSDHTALDERFAAVQKTLQVEIQRLQKTFQDLIVTLLQGGLGNILDGFISLLRLGLEVISPFAAAIGKLSGAFGGLPSEIYAAVVALTALNAAQKAASVSAVVAADAEGASTATRAGSGASLLNIFTLGALGRGASAGTTGVVAGSAEADAAAAAGGGGAFAGLTAALGGLGAAALAAAPAVAAIIAIQTSLNTLSGFQKQRANEAHDLKSKIDELFAKDPDAAKAKAAQDVARGQSNIESFTNHNKALSFVAPPVATIAGFFSGKTPAEQGEDEYQKLQGEIYKQGLRHALDRVNGGFSDQELLKTVSADPQLAGLLRGKTGTTSERVSQVRQTLIETLKNANPKDNATFKRLEDLFKVFESNDASKSIDSYLATVKNAKSESEKVKSVSSAVDSGEFDASAQDLKSAFQAGDISFQTFVTKITAENQTLKDAIAHTGDPTEKEKLIQQLLKSQKDTNQVISQRIADATKIKVDLGNLTGGDHFKTDLSLYLTELKSPGFTDTSQRLSAVGSVVQLLQQELQKKIDDATKNSEKAAIAAKGLLIPPEIRTELFVQAITATNSQFQDAATNAANITGETTVQAADFIGADMLNTGHNLARAVSDYLSKKDKTILAAIKTFEQTQTQGLTGLASFTSVSKGDAIAHFLPQLESDTDAILKTVGSSLQALASASGQSVAETEVALADLSEKTGLVGLALIQDFINIKIQALTQLVTFLANTAAQQSFGFGVAGPGVDPATQAAISRGLTQIANLQNIARSAAAPSNTGFTVPRSVTIDPTGYANKAATQAANTAYENAKAFAELLKALAGQDPVKQAQAALVGAQVEMRNAVTTAEKLRAQAGLVTAQKDLQRAQLEASESAFQVYDAIAKAHNNGLADAQITLKETQQKLKDATAEGVGTASINQIKADVQNAQAALADFMNKIADSFIQVAESTAKAAGDSVGDAKLSLQLAVTQLNRAKKQGADASVLNDLQSKVIDAGAALRDADLKNREDTIDFNLQAKKISTAQAISQYQTLLNSANILKLTEQEKRDLILKIQQLRDTLSQNLAFNIPSEIQLPTLYQVRRADQLGGVGNVNDNRTINVNINVGNSPSSASQIADRAARAVVQVTNRNQSGVSGRNY